MKKLPFLFLCACATLATRLDAAPPAQGPADAPQAGQHAVLAGQELLDRACLDRDWIARASDNVCGLRDPNQLTNPAVIDFDTVLASTPEMKRVRDQGIDPKSAEGIQLRSAAVTRLTNACENVRVADGYCSVWKAVRHKDGRTIPDISSQVIALF